MGSPTGNSYAAFVKGTRASISLAHVPFLFLVAIGCFVVALPCGGRGSPPLRGFLHIAALQKPATVSDI